MAARTGPLRVLHLCAGYGGWELALRSVVPTRTVCHVEWDAYAASVLVARMAEKRLDQAPVWSDVTTFDGQAWRGRVDVITAGFPCQPFSSAGRKRGVDDERWLWPDIARIVRDVEPGYVILENVRQLVQHGLPEVLYDLADLGFDAEWGCLTASAVGAPHRRDRWWCLAYTKSEGRPKIAGSALGDEGQDGWPERCDVVDGSREDVADTAGFGWDQRIGPAARRRWDEPQNDGPAQPCGFPPGPDDHTGWDTYIASGGPEPALRRSTDGPPLGLADSLHLGGNGMVPQCGAEAIRQLARRMTDG